MSPTPALSALRDRAQRHTVSAAAAPSDLSEADVRHLVRRTTFGAGPDLLADLAAAGPAAWLDSQLDPASIDDRACDGYLRTFPQIFAPVSETRAGKVGNWTTMQALGFATVTRYTYSRRQLFEVVCDLWSNHLNVTNPSSDVWDTRHDYDSQVIRRHALGTFADMLAASVKHPAMLRYLDAASSKVGAPNENYARELLELHTVGVGSHTETDVREAARVLTGMTVDWKTSQYRFNPKRHDGGAATVLGLDVPARDPGSGESAIDGLVRRLATDRRTATFVCTTIARRFVADDPPRGLVERLADVWVEKGSAIVPVLRALFASEEFWASKGQKTRRPMEGFIAAVRALGHTPNGSERRGLDSLYWQCRELGQAPLAWVPPNGYADVASAWTSAGATLARWNATTLVTNGWYPSLERPAPQAVLGGAQPKTYAELADVLARALLQRPPTPLETRAIARFCDATPEQALDPRSHWLSGRLSYVVQTFLNSPGHMER